MQLEFPDMKAYRFGAAAFLVYLTIALVMFSNISANAGSVVPNGGGDVYQSMWGLWWVPFSVFTLHQSPYVTGFLFYPLGANLVSETMVPLAGIVTTPLQALAGVAITYNVLFFLSFALGGLFMFMLAKYLTNNNYAAFIAGLIFAFSPMHIAQSYSHLQWTITEFIPLFVLFFIMMIRTGKRRYAAYSAISFVFLTFMGDIEQGIMMVSFVAISIAILFFLERKDILSRRFASNLLLFGTSVLIIGSPFFISMAGHLNGALGSASQLSDVAHNMLYSDNLASFFLPSYYNGIFHAIYSGALLQSVYGTTYHGLSYTPDITEKVSYIGYSVIFLVLLALYHERRRNRLKDVWYWIAIFVVFLLFALGPDIQIMGSSTGIPTLYSAYRAIPFFNLVREPGRFDVVVTVALAALAAVGFDHLSKSRYGKNVFVLTAVFAILILVEYNGAPLSRAFANSLTTGASISPIYGQIGRIQGNFSVLILPALPNLTTGSFLYPGMSMYYQSAFMKPLFGGYTTRENASQQQLLENVPLVVSAAYLQSGQGFVFPYPINENYSSLSLFWLTQYRVGMVAVINGAYDQNEFSTIINYLYSIYGNPVYENANVTVFDAGNIENLVGDKSLVSYLAGVWVPGYAFCSSSQQCNQSVQTMWFGQNVRAVTIFAPNATAARVSFEGMTYYPGVPLGLYLNNNPKPIAEFNLTSSPSNRSVEVSLPVGLSQVTFYQNVTSAPGENQYLNFGLDNITVR